MSHTCVIVGAGQAGSQTAYSLRQGGFEGRIILLGEEPQPPYQRPPLSKKYLAGELEADRLWLRPESFYESQGIELRTDVHVSAIHPGSGEVECANGTTISYTNLVLATGTRPRALPLPGFDKKNVLPLRSIADVDRIRPAMKPGARLVIVGAGYIGLEVAAVAKGFGLDVTVLETQDRVLKRVVSPVLSEFFQNLHTGHGVDLRLGVGVSHAEGNDRASEVVLTDGTRLGCDLVLVAVGAAPNEDLAAECGLDVGDGILVDPSGRTSDPAILAAGDCTRFHSPRFGRSIRLESVQNAIDQAKAVASTICGQPGTYDPVPWFWSDQYDVKLQIAGLSQDHDQSIVTGEPGAGPFHVAYLRDNRLIAVDSINHPRSHMMARRALGEEWRADLLPPA